MVVGGCASYHAAVDHHLGSLAASLGDTVAAEAHFRAALAMHERLGAAERARKTVSARVRDALAKIGPVHPELADHLRSSLRMGTLSSYSPAEPVTWTLS